MMVLGEVTQQRHHTHSSGVDLQAVLLHGASVNISTTTMAPRSLATTLLTGPVYGGATGINQRMEGSQRTVGENGRF